jgi:DNA-binding NarL/FixJ family response regulator
MSGPEQRAMQRGDRIRILQVDDNRDATVLMKHLLKREPDLEIVGTRHDAEGLEEEIRRTSPDVLLVDLMMPGRDPIEAIREVHATFPALRILVLSGMQDPRLLEQTRAAGATGQILKSWSIHEMLDTIRASVRA